MFVCTIKWNKGTAVFIVLLIAAILVLLTCAIANSSGKSAGVSANSAADVADYLESLGWEVDTETAVEKQVVIPERFSNVYEEYNSLQKAQGFDLSQYSGQGVTIYSLTVTNYSGYSGNVVADVYVCCGKIIGGDIHSLELDGFMHGLTRNTEK